jgi:hypothetical protein
MKKTFLRLGLAFAALSFALIAPSHATNPNCLRMLPYPATSIQNCFDVCAAHDCGYGHYNPSTHYCQCGYMY